MKIRLMGTEEECAMAAEELEHAFEILEISNPYPNRGNSRLVRVYLEVRMRPPTAPPTHGVTVTRADHPATRAPIELPPATA